MNLPAPERKQLATRAEQTYPRETDTTQEIATAPRRCTYAITRDILAGKWKGIILLHLFTGTKRHSELRRLMPAITQRVLTLQLRELESDHIIRRTIYAEIPPRVEYSITPLGSTLEPILRQMQAWGE
jgi:DNA-binding HxlR family transcriptional regulator